MSVKKRTTKRVEKPEQKKLKALLNENIKPSPEEIERRLAAWRGIFGLLSDPEEYAEWEQHAHRKPLFGGREEKSDDH